MMLLSAAPLWSCPLRPPRRPVRCPLSTDLLQPRQGLLLPLTPRRAPVPRLPPRFRVRPVEVKVLPRFRVRPVEVKVLPRFRVRPVEVKVLLVLRLLRHPRRHQAPPRQPLLRLTHHPTVETAAAAAAAEDLHHHLYVLGHRLLRGLHHTQQDVHQYHTRGTTASPEAAATSLSASSTAPVAGSSASATSAASSPASAATRSPSRCTMPSTTCPGTPWASTAWVAS
jgi:hypothetical protein